jgi:hypothetical protein
MDQPHFAIVELFADLHFIVKLEKVLRHMVSKSGAVELYDLPYLVIAVVEFTSTHYVSIHKFPVEAVWEELMNEVLDHFGLIREEQEEDYRSMIKGLAKLMFIYPDVVRGKKPSFLDRLRCTSTADVI